MVTVPTQRDDMSLMHWRKYERPAPLSNEIHVGEPIFGKCECGKDIRISTGEHVVLETISLEEFLERHKPICIDKEPA